MSTEKKNRAFTLVELLVVLGIIVVLFYLFILFMQFGQREAIHRMQCRNHQKQIVLALLNYHEKYGQFPPAYVADEKGKPLYSWRVLILPFLEQEELYEKFHLDEPWNSPYNKKLLGTELDYFRCQSSGIEEPGMTNYVLITGPGTIYEGGEPCSLTDITSGTSNTIIVMEVAAPGVHWAEPKDLKIDEIDPRFLDEEGNLKSNHPSGFNVAFADGHVQRIPKEEILEALKNSSQIKADARDWRKKSNASFGGASFSPGGTAACSLRL